MRCSNSIYERYALGKSAAARFAIKHGIPLVLEVNAPLAYELLDEQGPDHSKCFEICARLAGRRFSSAWGASKKEAEQKAARNALLELDLLSQEQ